MSDARRARPITFLFLNLPSGISQGFISVTLPFVLTGAGIPVATTASIVAIAMLPNTWRFLGAPLIDLSLTLRRWYALGAVACAATLLLLAFMPARPDTVRLITAAALLSQVGAMLLIVPVGGMMAHCVADDEKGRAAGWYQAGNLGGTGLGGGAGVWLASHFGVVAAGAVLAGLMLACAGALAFVPEVAAPGQPSAARLGERLRAIGRDFRDVTRSAHARLVIVLILSPIGIGAASNLWSAIAPSWDASPDQVALVTGVVYGFASILGCVVGGWVADRVGRWWVYFGSGILMALVALTLAAAARTPALYTSGVLAYAIAQGLANAAFSALLLHAIGRGAAATKYAMLSSLGNIPVIYMTAIDGWAHDRWGAGGLLRTDALLGVIVMPLALAALWWIRSGARERRPAVTPVAAG